MGWSRLRFFRPLDFRNVHGLKESFQGPGAFVMAQERDSLLRETVLDIAVEKSERKTPGHS